MTYCVGMIIDEGLVFMSDTRTNAGVDNISVFAKTRIWHQPGDRTLVMMSSGNLATTQAVLGRLDARNAASDDLNASLTAQPSMFMTAELVGKTLREEIARRIAVSGPSATTKFSASIILGGQIAGGPPHLFLIYPEGNFIEATADTPFFQIGETKYGRPIIVRAYRPDLSFMSAVKLLIVSFDSTIKANLSVGLPLDVTLVERETLEVHSHRMAETDAYYTMISTAWGIALTEALSALADPDFGPNGAVPQVATDPGPQPAAAPARATAAAPALVAAEPAEVADEAANQDPGTPATPAKPAAPADPSPQTRPADPPHPAALPSPPQVPAQPGPDGSDETAADAAPNTGPSDPVPTA